MDALTTPIPDAQIARAVAALARGELVGLPTETVYGLAADAGNADAVRRVFALKGRPAEHPLIVHIADATWLPLWADPVPDAALALAAAFWPGPLTLVLRRAAGVLDAITGGQDTVALRAPAHPLARSLLRRFGRGIAAPSANRFGRISPTTAAHVRAEFGDRLPIVLDGGPCAVGIESTILDLSGATPAILRPGAISRAQIEAVIGPLGEHVDAPRPRVSGALESHYAPTCPLRLLDAATIDALLAAPENLEGVLVLRCGGSIDPAHGMTLPDDAAGYAHGLYAALRSLDARSPASILVESVPDQPAWAGVRDRLRRAAAGS
ncbi:MAG: threonylcarbamoyl-AMP synthase [Proteobacteria bacterium]|nr:threonylcarbamoyl-AMP synthase [Pseudomonadota bacterium]